MLWKQNTDTGDNKKKDDKKEIKKDKEETCVLDDAMTLEACDITESAAAREQAAKVTHSPQSHH